MKKFLNHVISIVIIAFIFLFPSFFLTTFTNVFDFPKVILIVTTILLLSVALAAKLIADGKFSLTTSRADLPMLLIAVAYVTSVFLRTPNKMEAFLIPGIATVVVGGFLLYFFTKVAFKNDKLSVANALLFSGLLISVVSIFAFLGVFQSIPQLPELLKRQEFSAMGGKLPEVIFLTILLPLGIGIALDAKDQTRKIFYFLSTFTIAISLILSLTLILPGKKTAPVIVDSQTSWEVAVDTLKISPVLGVGAGNYLSAFSRFLPLSYNNSELWANRFLSGSSFVLTLVTETGVFGLAAFALTLFTLLQKPLTHIGKIFRSDKKSEAAYLVSLILLVFSFLVLPASTVLIILFFFLGYLNSEHNETTVNLSATSIRNGNLFVSKMPSALLAIILLALSALLAFFGTKALAGERKYKTAVDAIIQNDAKTAYNSLRDAINKNSRVDRYHATNAQLNLALARSLSQKQDITEADRTAISQLIQQSIAEAKATVALNPQRSANWETLARTYQAIMPFAQGADNFTITSFNQAIALDPINPNLRIALGGVYYALGRYDDAINAFGLAVTAKSDLANAHYNLAIAYREKKEFDKAIQEINTVLSLVKPNTKDYELAQKTLDELKKSKPEATEGTENLTPPQKAQEPVLTPPLELPQEATPPAGP